MRPGPASIPAGECAGGVIVHVYDQAGVLLSTSHLTPDTDVEADAERSARQAAELLASQPGGAMVIVAYDGDSGRRLSIREWLEWLLT